LILQDSIMSVHSPLGSTAIFWVSKASEF
jgi:acetyl-CoA carboxylase alpha subunit